MEVSQQGMESLLNEAGRAYDETENIDHFDPSKTLSQEDLEEYAAQLGTIDDVFEIAHRLEEGECERTETIMALITDIRGMLMVLHQRANMIRMIFEDGDASQPSPRSVGNNPKTPPNLFDIRFKPSTLTA